MTLNTPTTPNTHMTQVAVIGSGLAGAACAAGLQRAGAKVSLFEKAPTIGGRVVARRADWIDASGAEQSVTFDDNADYFTPVRQRPKPAIARAMTANGVRSWRPYVYAAWPTELGQCVVPPPAISPLCTHLLGGACVYLNRTVRRLQRTAAGSWYVATDGSPLAGPFHSVAVALPAAQAAVLLAGHQDKWANVLLAKRTTPVWTLIAVTDDIDWSWDAAQPERGPLAWVQRNDRLPGSTTPPGFAVWTAHATAEWSAAHSEDDPQTVLKELKNALRVQLPNPGNGHRPICWHYTDVYCGRRSELSTESLGSIGNNKVWWDESLALGLCGSSLGDTGVEAAWYSGDQLAECMAASFERSAVTNYDSAALELAPQTTSSQNHSPITNSPGTNQPVPGMLVSPIQGEASLFAAAK